MAVVAAMSRHQEHTLPGRPAAGAGGRRAWSRARAAGMTIQVAGVARAYGTVTTTSFEAAPTPVALDARMRTT